MHNGIPQSPTTLSPENDARRGRIAGSRRRYGSPTTAEREAGRPCRSSLSHQRALSEVVEDLAVPGNGGSDVGGAQRSPQ